MISKITSSSDSNSISSPDSRGKEKVDHLASLTRKLQKLKRQIEAERVTHVRHQFSEDEKRMIRFVISQEYEPTEDVIQLLTRFISGTTSEIHEAFTIIKTENEEMVNEDVTDDLFLDLFCLQCLRFYCRRHMIGQSVITPAEQPPSIVNPKNERPCSDQCSLHLKLQDILEYPERHHASSIYLKPETVWTRLEKDMYSSGLKMFGRNSCLIARELLPGLKTCIQVYKYMHAGQAGPSAACPMNDHEEPQSSLRGKNKTKRQKLFGKSVARQPTSRGSTNENRAIKQYTPCDCKSGCGKDCPCLKSSNCCEKYCRRCPKSCRNRYEACHCTKSRCRGQQCPCRVAGRECDPDVCRNCWVSGPLGEPARKGEGQCGNMRLLLKQQKRILMGESDVSGWGVFLQSSADKDDLIGEYTGELIFDEDADVRGNLYKDANTPSFLFNLNDQYVIDPIRKGSKLKFANPNCYAKVMKVAGDHRVAIFAKKRIEAGEELFYDYSCAPDVEPVWALKPDDPNEGPSAPQARARKPPSHRSPVQRARKPPSHQSPVQQSPLHRSLFKGSPVHRSRLSRPPLPRSPLPRSPLAGPPLPTPLPRPPTDN